MFNRDFIAKVRDASDLVAIASEYVELRKSGNSLKGLSPFNEEKTASFFIDPQKQFYKCFSTNEGGDVFDFVQKMKGYNFYEAVEYLAEQANIPVPKTKGRAVNNKQAAAEQEQIKKMLKLNRFVAKYFHEMLLGKQGESARKYLSGREVSDETVQKFYLGYAPDGWNNLRDFLTGIKAPLDIALELGLLKVRNDEKPRPDGRNLFDAFRNRLIFPIKNSKGDVVGFGGRALGKDDSVKYLNSPESKVYNKGHILYNFDRARKSIRDTETVVLVEGYMDCVAVEQAGLPNVVAPLGTALTGDHVRALLRSAKKVVTLLDGDKAGIQASWRSMDLFLQIAGFAVQGVHLPDSQDPDDFLRQRPKTGCEELRNLVLRAPALLDKFIENLLADTAPTMLARSETLEKIAKKMEFIQDRFFIETRISMIASRLQLDQKVVAHRLLAKQGVDGRNERLNRPLSFQKNKKLTVQNDRRQDSFELRFLENLVHYLDWLPTIKQMYTGKLETFIDSFEQADVRAAVSALVRGSDFAQDVRDLIDNSRENEVIRSTLLTAAVDQKESSAEGYLQDALFRLSKRAGERKRKELLHRISVAEFDKDFEQIAVLQNELQNLIRQTKSL